LTDDSKIESGDNAMRGETEMKITILNGYEEEVVSWYRRNYKTLGYDEILEENTRSTPDFVMLRKGKKIKVEIETHSGDFYIHKHKIEDVDEVLCVVLDKELPDKTIKLKQLIMWYQLPENE
jgi:hypothetical protein